MKIKIEKKHIILITALIVPFGIVALGLWKTYELLKKEDKNETPESK